MIRSLLAPLVLACACVLPACTMKSINPAYTAGAAVQEPALLGTWKNPKGNLSITLSPAANGEYNAAVTISKDDTSETVNLHIVLFRAGGRLLADSTLADEQWKSLGVQGAWLLNTHLIARIDIDGERVKIRELKAKAVDDALRADESLLDHAHRGNETILSGSSRQLSAFLELHAKDDAYFDDSEWFTRADAQPSKP